MGERKIVGCRGVADRKQRAAEHFITTAAKCLDKAMPIILPGVLRRSIMKIPQAVIVFFFSFSTITRAADGLIVVKSPHSPKDTMERLEAVVKEKGLTIFARIDHAAGAAKVGKKLRSTELLIFGNPQGGTPFMECSQTVGIDLPLKALVWEDASGQVWLGYNDPEFLAKRHGVMQCPAVENLKKALAGFAQTTVSK
jgi:uncharacterized protein (DUF302 family)